jgi:hypothetical protein
MQVTAIEVCRFCSVDTCFLNSVTQASSVHSGMKLDVMFTVVIPAYNELVHWKRVSRPIHRGRY